MNGMPSAGGDFLEPAGGVQRQLLGFDHAGSGDEEKRPVQPGLETAELHVAAACVRGTSWAWRARAAWTYPMNSG